MTISLTLTVEILLGKENDRRLLTSTPLLSQKNPQERQPPRDLPRPDAIQAGAAALSEELGSAMEGRLDAPALSIHLFILRLPSEH